MFPDSNIAKGYKLAATKVSYIITHGLGPYFLETLVEELQGKYFTLHFDETTTIQVKKQMDILIWFYSSKSGSVQVQFLKAVMFGHAFADTVKDAILDVLTELELPVSNILSIAADGPNVNKAIKKKLDMVIVDACGKGLVDIGFCNLHVVHNSFRKGLDKYGSTAEDLCINVFYFFKRSSTRREDYQKIQEELALDEHNFLRHACRD